MSNSTMLNAKHFYESTIAAKLAEALNIKTDDVTATWNIDNLDVRVQSLAGNNVLALTFNYKSDDTFTFSLCGYKLLTDESTNAINGCQVREIKMDYGTLTTLKDMFKDVMESEPTEAAKEDNDAE